MKITRRRALAAACTLVLLMGVAARAHAAEAAPAPASADTTAKAAAAADTSLDGRWIALVRATPGDTLEGPSGTLEKTQLWLLERASGHERLLLAGGAKRNPNGIPLANFQSPRFSPDGGQLYFEASATVTSDVVEALDVASGALREVCPGNSLGVVRHGQYRGDLVVEQHRYRRAGGAYDWLYLVNPAGRTLLVLGDPGDARVAARVADMLAGRAR